MRPPHRLDLSYDAMDLAFSLDDGLALERWKIPSTDAWIDGSSPLFAIIADGRAFDGRSPKGSVRDVQIEVGTGDATHAVIAVGYLDTDLEVHLHIVIYPGTALLEQWVTVRNTGARPMRIERLDSFALHLPAADYNLLSFSSSWGAEFEGMSRTVNELVVLESQSGRSSNGMHPFFVLSRGEEMLSGAVAWSGNWAIRFSPDGAGYLVSGGLSDWEFFIDLRPGGELEAPRAIVGITRGDLNHVAQQYHQIGRRHWYPRNKISGHLPLEWNHWWSYEDRDIDEDTFHANVEVAAELGLELCTLDAGWFGASDRRSHWDDYRGDWHRVNSARFASGIRSQSDHAHEHGLLFGLWCEIEGLSSNAVLGKSHPGFRATRDSAPLGYVCFGCPDVQEWALLTLERLVTEYNCDWIKLDFNVDAGAGCNRSDHGHGPGEGLYAHYRGYYSMLSRFRARHPEVALENCSSGGLRIDLGIMRHTHVTFLSDPDWPEHNLQVFWGATLMLAPDVCLNWGPSEWMKPHPHQTFDPHDTALTRQRLDYHIRTALLGAAGISLRLPDLPQWVADRIAFHARLYKSCIRHFVRNGDLYRLTDQPRRDGRGDRWCAFQYSLPKECLVFVFRLAGAEPGRALRLRNLEPAANYRITIVDDESERRCGGNDLMREGMCVDWLNEQESTVLIISEEPAD